MRFSGFSFLSSSFHLAVLALFVVAAAAAPSSSYAGPSAENYAAPPTVTRMSVSPSGKRVAFRKHDNESDRLLVYSLKDKKFKAAVDLAEINPGAIYFINEDQIILTGYKNQRLFGYRGRINLGTAYVVDANSGEVRQLLIPGDVIYKGQSGLGSVVGVSPDGSEVYMPAFVPRSKTDRSPDYSLVRVSLEKRRSPRVVRRGSDDSRDYFMDENGEVLAEERYDDRNDMHEVLARHGDDWEVIFSQKTAMPDISIVGVTPDRKSLVVLDEHSDTGRLAYYTMAIADGKITGPLFAREDADIADVLTDINRVVYGVRYSGFKPSYSFFNKDTQKLVDSVLAEFPEQSVWLTDWSPDWSSLVLKIEGNSFVGNYMLWHEGELSPLASARPDIANDQIHPVIETAFKASDGLRIPLLVTVPREQSASLKNLPAIMLPHGGPASYDHFGFDFLAQVFANEGYVVLQPQFRGSWGFGLAHKEAGYGEWGRKMQSDLTDALAALTAEKIVNPERVCIVGWSYGGYAALAGGALTPDLYRCVVSINGVSDLPEMLDQEESDHGDDSWVLEYWRQNMARNSDEKDILEAVSPSRHADKFTAPVLLLHGQRDEVVDIKQSKIMYKALKKADKKVKFKTLKGDNHSLIDRDNRIEAITDAVKFVNKHIGE